MYYVKPFVPKIYVEYPTKTLVFNTIEEYKLVDTSENDFSYYGSKKYTEGNPYYACTVCNLAQNKIKDYSPTCMVERKVPDYNNTTSTTAPSWSYYQYKTVIVENTKGHNIVPIVRLRNELGDPVETSFPLTEKQKTRNLNSYSYNYWIEGNNSPELRGLLPAERNRIDAERNPKYGWQHKYRHAIANRPTSSYYRRIKTFNERKQCHASQVEEYSPKVRARRNISGMPNDWDDYYPHYEKSWKSKKIKKQWMLNL
jgi:hypothetical protein